MRNPRILVILLSLLFLCIISQAACGAEAGRILAQGDLQQIFTEIIRANIPDHIEDIRISDFSSQPDTLSLARGEITYSLTDEPDCASPGKKFIAAVLAVNNKEYGKVKMQGDLHFLGTVVIASRPLPKNGIINSDDVKTDFRDISMLGGDLIRSPEQALDKQTNKSLRTGDILFGQLLNNPPLVKRGDRVTILAKRGSVQVTVPGEVKNTGARGETVRVKNLMSHRVLDARVVEEKLVEIDL
ncbi:MAG: flagellar basal body P-ring formation protein FlgA [Deltaproteobacteria bacterium]|nr:flagellar basal body P-ring formation protein FlgA [Deltaproteobacteria bacterium]